MSDTAPASHAFMQKRVTHVAFATGVALLLTLYWPTVYSLPYIWAHDGTFQYAFLIFPVSLWLIVGRRQNISDIRARPSPLGMASLAGVSGLWLLGYIVDVNLVQQLALIAAIPMLVLAVYGAGVVRALLFPLAYLFFALPIGDSLVGHMQTITARISVFFLQLTHIPVYLDSHFISTPHVDWHVAQACSGIKFFIACLALGTLYAHLFYTSWKRRLTFVAASLVVPIIANGLRVYFTVLIGETFGVQYASGTDHEIFGWQFFGTVLILLFLAGWHWREPPRQEQNPFDSSGMKPLSRSSLATIGGAMVLLAAGPVIALTWVQAPHANASTVIAKAPEIPGWQCVANHVNPLGATYGSADTLQSATYARGPARISLVRAVYLGAPHQQHDLLTFKHWFYSRPLWNPNRTRVITISNGHRVVSVQLKGNGKRRLLWYWYAINGSTLTSGTLAKVQQAWTLLSGRRLRSVAVSLSVLVGPDGWGQARKELKSFAKQAWPVLQNAENERPAAG